MVHIHKCEKCSNDGLIWVAFDKKDWAIDLSKKFKSSKRPVPQLAPCSCFKGHKQCPSAKANWRSQNGKFGFAQQLKDGSKGREVIEKMIDENWGKKIVVH